MTKFYLCSCFKSDCPICSQDLKNEATELSEKLIEVFTSASQNQDGDEFCEETHDEQVKKWLDNMKAVSIPPEVLERKFRVAMQSLEDTMTTIKDLRKHNRED